MEHCPECGGRLVMVRRDGDMWIECLSRSTICFWAYTPKDNTLIAAGLAEYRKNRKKKNE